MSDAPSNKTYGNCLLGFHCSQCDPAATRANSRYFVVAGYQHEFLSTVYPQTPVDVLGTVSVVATPASRRRERRYL